MHTDHSSADPEIQAERAYLDTCRAALRRTLHDVRTALDTGAGEGDAVLDKVLNHSLRQLRSRQVTELTADLDGAPLFFGRLDYPSQRRYVGRRGIRDEHGRLLVIDWRAPVARAFYEASRDDPMHVTARRRYGFDDAGVLTAFEDERLDRPATAGGTGGLLAAEIERPRKGPMRDIVATIQPEQMRLVRAPADRTLCVQGAPGTGKTAVGLHRLAYLLYRERERLTKHGGVAVIGPNRSFRAGGRPGQGRRPYGRRRPPARVVTSEGSQRTRQGHLPAPHLVARCRRRELRPGGRTGEGTGLHRHAGAAA